MNSADGRRRCTPAAYLQPCSIPSTTVGTAASIFFPTASDGSSMLRLLHRRGLHVLPKVICFNVTHAVHQKGSTAQDASMVQCKACDHCATQRCKAQQAGGPRRTAGRSWTAQLSEGGCRHCCLLLAPTAASAAAAASVGDGVAVEDDPHDAGDADDDAHQHLHGAIGAAPVQDSGSRRSRDERQVVASASWAAGQWGCAGRGCAPAAAAAGGGLGQLLPHADSQQAGEDESDEHACRRTQRQQGTGTHT